MSFLWEFIVFFYQKYAPMAASFAEVLLPNPLRVLVSFMDTQSTINRESLCMGSHILPPLEWRSG